MHMKPRTNVIAAAVALAGLGAGMLAIALVPRPLATASSRQCSGRSGALHTVTIQHNQLDPARVTARLCDRLTITNLDDRQREIAFGQHSRHTAYNGVTERVLGRGDSLTVTLNRAGIFTFHDHLQDEVAGTFTVEAK